MIDAIDSIVLNFPRQFGFCEKLKKIAGFLRWFKGEEERRERVDERISKILTGESIGKRDPLFFFFCNIPPLAFRFISKAVFPRARSLLKAKQFYVTISKRFNVTWFHGHDEMKRKLGSNSPSSSGIPPSPRTSLFNENIETRHIAKTIR